MSYWTRTYYCCQGPNFECWHNRFSMHLNIKDIIRETDLPGSLILSSKFCTGNAVQVIVAGVQWLILDPVFLLEGQKWYLMIKHKTRTLGSYTSLFMLFLFSKRVKKGTNMSSFISKCYLKRVFSFCRRKYSNAQLLGLSVDDEMLL